uniref:SFRICE_039762 n=1 Tax=Spodoptera frugiperda TaxID=7108 RepID=A0A2H1WF14_SPOFR
MNGQYAAAILLLGETANSEHYTNLKSMISTRNIKLNQNEKRANCQTKKLQAPTRRASARSESALLTDEGTTHDPSRLSMRPIHYTTFG